MNYEMDAKEKAALRMESIVHDMMENEDLYTDKEICKAISTYELIRIADNLDRICSVLDCGITTYPS